MDPLQFVTPTEFVELPSKGKFYPEGHALHNQEVVEIKYMTAKDEDILTSRALLKKGLAIDRFIKNIKEDKSNPRIHISQHKAIDTKIPTHSILVCGREKGGGKSY